MGPVQTGQAITVVDLTTGAVPAAGRGCGAFQLLLRARVGTAPMTTSRYRAACSQMYNSDQGLSLRGSRKLF